MDKEETRGRKMRSDNVRVIPEFREHMDIENSVRHLSRSPRAFQKINPLILHKQLHQQKLLHRKYLEIQKLHNIN